MNRELSLSSRRLLETAYLCALNNHSQYITPEHILAALFQGNEFLSVTECLGETGNNICNILNMFISSLARVDENNTQAPIPSSSLNIAFKEAEEAELASNNTDIGVISVFISISHLNNSLASHILNSEVPEIRMSLIDYISNAIEYL